MSIDASVEADPERFMAAALAAARTAGEAGDVPIGAVAVVEGRIVATAANRRERDRDPTAHAEVLVVRELAAMRGDWRLGDVTVVVTLEPCPLCAGALWAARVGGLVYGAADPKAGAIATLYGLAADPRLNHEYPVRGGVLAEECGALLSSFFRSARSPGER